MKGILSSLHRFTALSFILFALLACEKKQPEQALTRIEVELYDGFLDSATCELLDSLGQKISSQSFSADAGVSVVLNAHHDWVFASCTSDREAQALVLHGGQRVTSPSIKIAVNPFTEVAYRLSNNDRANMDKYLADIFSLMSVQVGDALNLYPVYDASLPEISDLLMAMMELIKSQSLKTDTKDDTKQLLLKNTISEIETAAKEQKSLKDAFTRDSIEHFIATHKLTDELQAFFLGNLIEMLPQSLFYFVSPEIIRPLESMHYYQKAEGGSGEGVITYVSSDESIASVDHLGKVTFHNLGQVTIRAIKAEDDNYQLAEAYYLITINSERSPQANFAFAKPSVSVKLSDNTYQQVVHGGEGQGLIYYRSSDKSVAQVDSQGVVTFIKGGEVKITAFKGGDDDYLNAESSYVLSIQGILVDQGGGKLQGFSELAAAVSATQPGGQIRLSGDLSLKTPVDFSQSRGTSDNPIVITGMDNKQVTLSGLQPVSEFTQAEWVLVQSAHNTECIGRCYSLSLNQAIYALWVEGKRYTEAHWPNPSMTLFDAIDISQSDQIHQAEAWESDTYWAEGLLKISENDQTLWTLTHQSTHEMPNISFVGAEITIKTASGALVRMPITQHEVAASTMTLEDAGNQLAEGGVTFSISHRHALDFPGEYFYDDVNQQLWVYPEDVVNFTSQAVEVRTHKAGLQLSDSSYIKFRHLVLLETTAECQANCSHIHFDQVSTQYPLTDHDQLSQMIGMSAGSEYLSTSFAHPLSRFYQEPSIIIAPSSDQRVIPPLSLSNAQGFVPLSHGQGFSDGQAITLRWITPKDVTNLRIMAGSSMDSLTTACESSSISVSDAYECTLSGDFSADGAYFWQVDGQLNNQAVRSPIWMFRIGN
ncbi:MAG: Ig-like domain-containing protein [Cellvibrionales bacterium]|nr:Ig-like domain-containing protein [Cellvibrionales bacterium]